MATIALIWESGADLGHISRFRPIVLRLKALGHRPILILKDTSHVDLFFSGEEIDVYQAPIETSPIKNGPKQINFTKTLLHVGYHHEAQLANRLSQWEQLYNALGSQKIRKINREHEPYQSRLS